MESSYTRIVFGWAPIQLCRLRLSLPCTTVQWAAILGHPPLIRKLKKLFYWPDMRSAVLKHVQAFSICAQVKPDRSAYLGLLQPLPVPRASWKVISLDFVEGLPFSEAANAILVVVDKFSKFAHFIPLKHPFSAASVARLFMDHIFKLHGMPMAIISDRDRVFTSQLW